MARPRPMLTIRANSATSSGYFSGSSALSMDWRYLGIVLPRSWYRYWMICSFVMYFDNPSLTPGAMPMPHVAMDQSFFDMEDGTRTVFKIKMTKGLYYNLVYTWGWRMHPPRAQVMENATKMIN